MLVCVLPIGFLGSKEHSAWYVGVCVTGLGLCCGYLWWRACWLLEAHRVTSPLKSLLFPGLLAPALVVLGTTIGFWALAMVLVAPAWPGILVPLTGSSLAIALPLGLVIIGLLRVVFGRAPTAETP